MYRKSEKCKQKVLKAVHRMYGVYIMIYIKGYIRLIRIVHEQTEKMEIMEFIHILRRSHNYSLHTPLSKQVELLWLKIAA